TRAKEARNQHSCSTRYPSSMGYRCGGVALDRRPLRFVNVDLRRSWVTQLLDGMAPSVRHAPELPTDIRCDSVCMRQLELTAGVRWGGQHHGGSSGGSLLVLMACCRNILAPRYSHW